MPRGCPDAVLLLLSAAKVCHFPSAPRDCSAVTWMRPSTRIGDSKCASAWDVESGHGQAGAGRPQSSWRSELAAMMLGHGSEITASRDISLPQIRASAALIVGRYESRQAIAILLSRRQVRHGNDVGGPIAYRTCIRSLHTVGGERGGQCSRQFFTQ